MRRSDPPVRRIRAAGAGAGAGAAAGAGSGAGVILALAVGLFAAGCAISLDHEFDDASANDDADAASGDAAAVVPGCEPFRDVAGMSGFAGDTRSLVVDGGALWIVDQALGADGGVVLSPSFAVSAGATAGCDAFATRFLGAALAPSPLAPGGLLSGLDLVQAAAAPALYYELFASDPSAPLGLRSLGVGVAPLDPGSQRFVPTAELLWSPDRPAYGGSAMRVGDTVYVYGCSPSGFLEDACFVARADASSLGSTAAYTYWSGAQWSASPDDAAPIATAGGIVSVRPDPRVADATSRGFVMTYVPPLGSTIVARTSIAPEGPWSGPTTLATCALDGAGPGAFCAGGRQHPELRPAAGAPLSVTYAAATFASDASVDAAAFAPRLASFPVP